MACNFPWFTQGCRLISVLMYSHTKPGAVMLILLVYCATVDAGISTLSAERDSELANPPWIRRLFYLTLNLSLVLVCPAL